MEIRAIEWIEIDRSYCGLIEKFAEKWQIQVKIDGQWKNIPVVDAGRQKEGYNPETFNNGE